LSTRSRATSTLRSTQGPDIYRIWYNTADKVALYGRVVWDAERDEEKLTKAWPEKVLAVLNAEDAKVHPHYKDKSRSKKSICFGGEPDLRPLSELYECGRSIGPP
jgi:hypothetical protein